MIYIGSNILTILVSLIIVNASPMICSYFLFYADSLYFWQLLCPKHLNDPLPAGRLRTRTPINRRWAVYPWWEISIYLLPWVYPQPSTSPAIVMFWVSDTGHDSTYTICSNIFWFDLQILSESELSAYVN